MKQNTTTGSSAGCFGSRALLGPPSAPPPPTATTRNLLRLLKDSGNKKKTKNLTHKNALTGTDPSSKAVGKVDRVEKPKEVIRSLVDTAAMNLISTKKPANVDIFGTIPTKLMAELKSHKTKVRDLSIPLSKKRKLEPVSSQQKCDVPLNLSSELSSSYLSSLNCRNPTEDGRDTLLNRSGGSFHDVSFPSSESLDLPSTSQTTASRSSLYFGAKKRKPLRIVQQQQFLNAAEELDVDVLMPASCANSHASNSDKDDDIPPKDTATITEPVPTRDVALTTSSTGSLGMNPYMNAASQSIPRPVSSKAASKPKDNYIRLNLRNKAGSCLGARNVRAKSKSKLQWEQRRKDRSDHFQALQRDEEDLDDDRRPRRSGSNDAIVNQLIGKSTTLATSSSGIDVVDDFVDGVFALSPSEATAKAKKKAAKKASPIPLCTGHQQPCKVLTVKKSGPNRGRQFYACACPRMEQCNHFAWADDTLRAAQDALLKNQSVSGFIARRVSAYMDQIQNLTVPELKELAARNQLDSTGNKLQLRTRLSVWVRDEVAKGTVDLGIVNTTENVEEDKANASEVDYETDEHSSSSDEELELTGKKSDSYLFLRSGSAELPPSCDPQVPITDFVVDLNGASETHELPIFLDPNKEAEASINTALKMVFGYDSLRDGQEWVIRRCLNRQRSLLVAPTGFGKSLCYALPAAMMDGICIVVSPLLSLIQDQIRMIPARLAAATLSGPMSTAATAATLDDIVRGRIKLLFVSPERLTSASFRRLFRRTWNSETKQHERYFPQVSLLCVDEAHCMSQWAHNFRPSYLRLRSIIDIIEPQSVLAITATAGPRVIDDICRTLCIENNDDRNSTVLDHPLKTSGVRVSKTNRDNIDVKCLFLDTQEERLSTLLTILGNDKKFSKSSLPTCLAGCLATGSVIVYTWRQQDAEVVAENIQASDISGGVVVYHGGMDATSRAKAQSKFMRGKARICVATIAFGLGINKADVAGVIHLYLSSSPEHYIQEIGRAGRDGRTAQAISLLLNDEVFIRHSLAHADLISRSQVKALLSILDQQVEASLMLLNRDQFSQFPVNISFQLATSILGCDCKVETAETILSLLEERNGKEPLLFVQGTSYDSATVAPRRCILEDLAQKEPIAKAILQCSDFVEPPAGQVIEKDDTSSYRRNSNITKNTYGSFSFSVAKCSNCLGDSAEPRHVFAALRRLEANGDIDFSLATDPKDRVLSLRLTNEGMRIFGNGNQNLIESLVDETTDRFVSTISTCSNKVLDIHYIMRNVFEASRTDKVNVPCKKSASLSQFQRLIETYFEAEGIGSMLATEAPDLPNFTGDLSGRELSADVEIVLSHFHDMQGGTSGIRLVHLADSASMDYTVLLITKFLHGLAPPSISVHLVRNHHLFGKMQSMQFTKLHDAVSRLLVSKGEAPNKLRH